MKKNASWLIFTSIKIALVIFISCVFIQPSLGSTISSHTNPIKVNWQKMQGPYGAQTNAIAVSQANPNLMYAGLYNGGIYRSIDGGKHWTKSIGVADPYIANIVIKQNSVYALTGCHGVYKSTDEGKSWIAVNNGLPSNVKSLIVANNNLYVMSNVPSSPVRIYVSINGGLNWEQVGNGIYPSAYSDALAVQGNSLYVGTLGNGIYKSNNDGQTWATVNNGLPSGVNISSIIGVNGVLYAGSYNLNGNGAVFKSTDGGQQWVPSNYGLGSNGITTFYTQNNNAIYAVAFQGIYESVDGGAIWNDISTPVGFKVLAVAVANSTLYAGTEGGIFNSTDGGNTWNFSNNGILPASVTSLYAIPNTSIVIAGTTSGGLYRSTDNGESWNYVGNNTQLEDENGILQIVADNNGNIYALLSYVPGMIFKSSDNGQTWQTLAPLYDESGAALSPTQLFLYGSNLYVGTNDDGIYDSQDGGMGWQLLRDFENNEVISGMGVYGSSQTLYVSTTRSDFFNLNIGTGNINSFYLNTLPATVNNIVLAKNNNFGGFIIYALTSQGLFQSADQGATWFALTNGLFSKANAISLLMKNNSEWILGTSNDGVFISSDKGQSWLSENNNLNLSLGSLTFNKSFLFAGTSTGVYRAKIGS